LIVTHRPEEEPEGGEFTFVSGVRPAVERAIEAAGGKDVHVMGGADVIRQALDATFRLHARQHRTVEAITTEERGLASSLVTESRQLGAVLGVAALGAPRSRRAAPPAPARPA
jgi:hypothetical protein